MKGMTEQIKEGISSITSPTQMKRAYFHLRGDKEKKLLNKILDTEKENLTVEDRNTLSSFSINDMKALVYEATKQGYEEVYNGFDVGFIVPKNPIDVLITGACGDVAYALIPRVCSGEMFGFDQPINLRLFDVHEMNDKLNALEMEVRDSAFPWLCKVFSTSDEREAFRNCDFCILCSGRAQKPGESRRDLITDNAPIYASFGKHLNRYAKRNTKVLVVGNPININCMILSSHARSIPKENITGLMRLDQNRAKMCLSKKLGVPVRDIRNVIVWGNSSNLMFPDISQAIIRGKRFDETWVQYGVSENWLKKDYMDFIVNRSDEILKYKGHTSSVSAADAIVKHMRTWVLGSHGEIVSMAVPTDGTHYNIKEGLWCSMPVICYADGKYDIIKNIKVDSDRQRYLDSSLKELYDEAEQVGEFLK